MSDRADLAEMGEPELRAWLERLPAQELVEIIICYVRAFLRDGVDDFGAGRDALGGLLEMSFPQIIAYLKENTRLPELSRLRVEGDEVKFQTAAGSDIIINATGLQDGPGVPGVSGRSGFARSTPDPNRTLRPQPPAAAAGAGSLGAEATEDEAPPRSAPSRRLSGLFDGGGSGTGEAGNEPPVPRAGTVGRPPTGPPAARPSGPPTAPAARPAPASGPVRPTEPPRVKPDAKGPEKKGEKKGGGGKKDDRFSMLEFD
ncbi:MAG: hypothetical protein FJ125_02055 [Deltaproteobacteria bacterium]|nr:hypothetical protein [Deltaproteobacteria bacterium]